MQKFDEAYSYLCVYLEEDLVEYVVNTHEVNKKYQETFKDIQQAFGENPEKQPFEMLMADSQTGNLAVRLTGENIGELELVEMDWQMMYMKNPDVFQPDDIS